MTMLEGRKYRLQGTFKGATSVRFADGARGGVATTAYNFAMPDHMRDAMARRIVAALNLTTHMSIEQIESAAPIEPDKAAHEI